MKVLLVAEYRQGRLAESTSELLGFADTLGGDVSMALVGSPDQLPGFDGRLHFADAGIYGEYDSELHKRLLLQAVEAETPDLIVFMHSSYGWDLAPRISAALEVALVSGVAGMDGDGFTTRCCNGKMRRTVTAMTSPAVLTLLPGAFPSVQPEGVSPELHPMEASGVPVVEFIRYEPPSTGGIDLTRSDVIVCAGRGVGSREKVGHVRALADALGGEVGATRPVVDAGWLEHGRQIGSTGQSVSPGLYVACGVSGAIQHLAGMKGAGFVIALNTDRDAPIVEVADLLVVADLEEFLPMLTAKLGS